MEYLGIVVFIGILIPVAWYILTKFPKRSEYALG